MGVVGDGSSFWRVRSRTSQPLSNQILGGCSCAKAPLEKGGRFIFSSGGSSRIWELPRGPIYSTLKILPENKCLPPLHSSHLHSFGNATTFWEEAPFTALSPKLPLTSCIL